MEERARLYGLMVVGKAHLHPFVRGERFLSATDRETMRYYAFFDPGHVFAVVNPKTLNYRFHRWSSNGPVEATPIIIEEGPLIVEESVEPRENIGVKAGKDSGLLVIWAAIAISGALGAMALGVLDIYFMSVLPLTIPIFLLGVKEWLS